jgi:hypothetical protein
LDLLASDQSLLTTTKDEWQHGSGQGHVRLETVGGALEKVPPLQRDGDLFPGLAGLQHLSAKDCWYVSAYVGTFVLFLKPALTLHCNNVKISNFLHSVICNIYVTINIHWIIFLFNGCL